MPTSNRKLRVFLCHASQDKPVVRELYQRLLAEGWIDPWLDEEKLLPGQDWDMEIEKAVEDADAVIVILSNNSVSKEGYIQREIRFVLGVADYKPEGTVYIVPLRLNNCPIPRRLRTLHYVDFFPENREEWAYERLLDSISSLTDKAKSSNQNTNTKLDGVETYSKYKIVIRDFGNIPLKQSKVVIKLCEYLPGYISLDEQHRIYRERPPDFEVLTTSDERFAQLVKKELEKEGATVDVEFVS
jgi:hypothetical protein